MAQAQLRLLPAELQELEHSWRTSNFPGLSGTVGKPVSDKVPSRGVLSWNKLTQNLRDLHENLSLPPRFPLVSGENHLTLQNNCPVGRRALQLCAGKKSAARCNTLLKLPHVTTVKTSKVNMRKAVFRFTSICKNQVGQVSTLMFGYHGPPLL